MTETGANVGVRILLSLAPVAFSALIGQAVYLLVWGIKLDGRVALNEGRITEMRQQLDKLYETVSHRIATTSNKFGSVEEQMNEQSARIDTIIALMKVRDRSDADYQIRRNEDRGSGYHRLQSNPSSSPP
jgi:hypothetical protein